MKVLLRLMPYIKPYWLLLLVGMGLAVVVSGMEGAIAYLVKPAMDDIFLKRDLLMLTLVPVALLLVYIIKGAARYGQSYLMATVGERVIATIRFDLYSHLQKLSLSFFSDQHSGELMSRLMNDVNRLARFSSQALVMAFRQMVTVVALLAVMFIREWLLTLF
ncbi:MAG TPA: ABC transporter transmembrane domain-containing protein, partial [Methylomirabilota bacterium]|nr:ABC transporter transmembrane domain-containing protein [Methylomirabilota bacterium]